MSISDVAAPSDLKGWAREHFRGFETILMPSFKPDLSDIDEEGIRSDVRRTIEHGCFSAFAVASGMNPDEARRFLETVADEAGGRLSVGVPIHGETAEASIEELRVAESAGCTHGLIFPPHTFHAATADDLYAYYRTAAEATSLGVVLWATDGMQFRHLHPSNVIVDVFDRLCDLPNVIALKLMTTLDLTTVFALCERTHEKVQIGGVHLGLMPLLVKNYGMQWSGAWTIEALQSPEQPYVVRYLEQMLAGEWDAALDTYWQMKPAYDALFGLMAPMLPKGVHPFTHLKYYQWCVGGNGGLLREPWDPNEREFPLTPADRQAIKEGFRTIGIEPTADPDECFIVGRTAYAAGVRASDVPVKNTYVE